jgi:diaminohydroxyphosphoribosylaminopyrimidine deaminase/5-amino-6-(5-phosphoribosylamino)uracil reductase
MRVVVDSLLRIPTASKMVQSVAGDLTVITTSAGAEDRRRLLEDLGVKILVFDGPGGRVDFPQVVEWLGGQKYLSLMIEAGSKVNWSALETGIVDKIFFYYAPKILGGMQSLPVAGGAGRRRRADAMLFRNVTIHSIFHDEFAVEAWLQK